MPGVPLKITSRAVEGQRLCRRQKKLFRRSEVKPPVEVKTEAPKTFSDAEILASVKPAVAPQAGTVPGVPKKSPFYAKVARPESAAQKKRAKAERKTPDDQTRLHINVGEDNGRRAD